MKINRIVLGFLFLGGALPALGLTPMEYFNSLVAGGDDPGYRDGNFSQARFNTPQGLAFNESGKILFVADTNNHCLRAIHLDENNRVETLAGTGKPGKTDGNFTKATFNQPAALISIPGNRLVVYEAGNHLLRMVNLKTRNVSTISGNKAENSIGSIWNMVYRASDNCLYFSQLDSMRKLDLKSSTIKTIITGNVQVPHPMALSLFQKNLYVADQNLPGVYRIDFGDNGNSAQDVVTLVEEGKGEQIQELTSSGGVLYGLQAGKNPLAQILPNYQPVTLMSPMGFLIDNENPSVEPFLTCEPNIPLGFVASPKEEHKLFISRPKVLENAVISIKDYDFEKNKFSFSPPSTYYSADFNYPPDFNYPKTKPPRTFRILVLGDSRVLRAAPFVSGLRDSKDLLQNSKDSMRVNTYPKQLEFLLNREAALRGVETHFEVLVSAHSGMPIPVYFDEALGIVGQYDIDLVLGMEMVSCFPLYFERPMTSEGIPSPKFDPEFILKPPVSRIPPGAPERFYKGLVRKGLIKQGDPVLHSYPWDPYVPTLYQTMDTDIRNAMLEMDGLLYKRFIEKLKIIKKSRGSVPKLALFYAPAQEWHNLNDINESYWKELCEKNQISYIDLYSAFNVLKSSFYPTNDSFDYYHDNVYGHALLAYLLSYYLPEQKLIPFDKAGKNVKSKAS